ncbi:cytochrome b562 [Amphritea sp. 1_MG-2023]|uniref:cytochrome b562 n=1 Tax=Amphritea sp. 1_MG-2023 TaxID=3062670 RepID=UPI0026E49491|nr:cytochrome b562 [Amphritea sp. 1_MG-2023]MDO6564817.1 cytochrome b562 [Amphritea sp. 1_MG-2023]
MLSKLLCKTPILLLLLSLLTIDTAIAGPLKPTMKAMRLHYKQAIDTQDPAIFNDKIAQFLSELETARAYNFSPERKALSLEGLNKVKSQLGRLPKATSTNLSQLQNQLREVDQLRVEYHKKVKPGVFELLLDTFKKALNL